MWSRAWGSMMLWAVSVLAGACGAESTEWQDPAGATSGATAGGPSGSGTGTDAADPGGAADGAQTTGGTWSVASSSSDGVDPKETGTETGAACAEPRPISIDGGCYPEVLPYAFHLIHRDFEASWDAIATLSEQAPEILLTSQHRPRGLPPDRWARRTSPSYFETPAQMAAEIHAAFADADDAPAAIVIDELRTEHIDSISALATIMAEHYPQWAGRWGVWLVHGLDVSYQALQPAIDALLLADARLVLELYPALSQYCAAATTTAGRDAWLTAYFRGGRGAFPQPRTAWLVERRAALGSDSLLSLAFGVTETYLDAPGAAVFLDRMFFVWRNHSGFGSLLFGDTGGVGAYKWHDHGPITRDTDFAASYLHYSVARDPAPRLGPPPC